MSNQKPHATLYIRAPYAIFEEIHEIAKEKKISANKVVVRALEKFIKKYKKEEKPNV